MLERIPAGYEELIRRFLFDIPRNESEILEAEREFFDRVWYNRKLVYLERIEAGTQEAAPKEITDDMARGMREMRGAVRGSRKPCLR
jgi:hypothetical protein